MEELQNLAKQLLSLNSKETDSVLDLMHEISLILCAEYDEHSLYDEWFSGKCCYLTYKEIMSRLRYILEPSDEKDEQVIFMNTCNILSELTVSSEKWYFFTEIEDTYHNTDADALRTHKGEFLSQLSIILESL